MADLASSTIDFAPRVSKQEIEQGHNFCPKFDAQGLIPCVTTDAQSGEVLMVAFMNAEALGETIRLGEAVYYSRSRAELWHKGKTSGHVQRVVELRVDCDQDCIWLRVEQVGAGACHVGYRSCFYRALPTKTDRVGDLYFVENERAYEPEKVYRTN